MASTMTWTVEVVVHVGSVAAEPGLGDRLLGALTAQAASTGPAVAQDTTAGTISTILTVTNLEHPDDALSTGRTAVTTALHHIGLSGAEVGFSVARLASDLTATG